MPLKYANVCGGKEMWSKQHFLAKHIPNSTLIEIDSDYGHDGFMVESKIISQHLAEWLGDNFVLGYGATI